MMQEKKSMKNLKIKKLTIIGVIPSFAFQRAKHCALELHRKLPQRFPLPEIVGLLELDWSEKLQEWRQTLGREYWCLRRPVAVFFDGKFIGSDIELIKLMTLGNILIENIPRKNMSFLKKHFRNEYLAYLRKTKRIYCYLDICINEVYAGTLTFQLFNDLLPRTCENFKTLCLGSRGPLLSYRGSRIHRIVKKGWLQGGDVQYKTGGGGFSIFCDPLEDESFGISHDKRGVLSMANAGRHANGSQFFITLQPSKWMDTHFVAFGQLIEGAKVLQTLENLETFYECPLKKVEIKSCGKLDLEDVEDVDVMYREEPLPKKPKRIENICEQVVRMIIEALTEALARKERAPDILDCGDIPSKMNLQLYFQGFYSLPESVLEESAAYLRNLRRNLLRVIKPSATEIVEVIMYDLLMGVLTRMTTLDDVRETIGHDMYRKMISGIDMNLEMCKKSYVRRLIDQIASTAENMVDVVSKKIQMMKSRSGNLKRFQNIMQEWVQSFVLQETFEGDNYFIADRPVIPEKPKEEEKQYPKREGIKCCEAEKKKKEKELLAKLMAKFGPDDMCCLGSKLRLNESEINLYDFFSTCRYDLKRVAKPEEDRMPLLDLIEICRYKLRFIRKQEKKIKDKEIICIEKKVRKWMTEVNYTPETSWLKDAVFPKDCAVLDHMEEILYGAMTAGLLEMYYFMEEYLKLCGMKKKKLVTKVLYPEDSDVYPSINGKDSGGEGLKTGDKATGDQGTGDKAAGDKEGEDKEGGENKTEEKEEKKPPCTCGHPCCKCLFDPKFKTPEAESHKGEAEKGDEEEKGSLYEDEALEEASEEASEEALKEAEHPCASDETFVDLNALLAKKISTEPDKIDIRSFNWLKPYILEKGCDLKSRFATQVHKWLEGESFVYKGFISKHSLATRASLLSLSFSLAELIKEENNYKADIRNFIYDLWNLYFEEMFKEAYLQYPPEPPVEDEEEEIQGELGPEDEKCDTDLTDLEKFCEKIKEESEKPLPQVEEVSEFEEKSDQEVDKAPPPQPKTEIEEPEQESEPVEEKPEEEETGATEVTSDHVKKEGDQKPAGEEPKEEEQPPKKKKSPIIIEEYVDASSSEESRDMPPYVLPFWVKFLTELTKQALGALAKVSRLPKRLFFQSDSVTAFDDKMKEWFEFNAFNPQPTKGREIMDYIAVHHKSLTNLEDTARSFLKKKKYSELINRCTRFSSADDMAQEIVADVIDTVKQETEHETLELFVSSLLSSAIAEKSQTSFEEGEDERSFRTDSRESGNFAPEDVGD